jgi:hypothetical protein
VGKSVKVFQPLQLTKILEDKAAVCMASAYSYTTSSSDLLAVRMEGFFVQNYNIFDIVVDSTHLALVSSSNSQVLFGDGLLD